MDIEVLQRAYQREKERRKQAELMLEEKSRELYLSHEKIAQSYKDLEQTNTDLKKKQDELVQLLNAYAAVTGELQLAAKLQEDLLPDPIALTTHAALGYFQPASFVAGDAYDFFMLSDHVFAFYIIDVEGHGAASAMTSFAIHSQLNPKLDGLCRRNLDNNNSHSQAVCSAVSELNQAFYNPTATNKYFTMVYGLLDLCTGTVTCCQAGHPAPILCSADESHEVGDGGFPVGSLQDPEYTSFEHKMLPGDRLAIYSDGVIENFSDQKELFGKNRLLDILTSTRSESQQQCVDSLKTALQDWNSSDEFADDVTMLLIDFRKTV